MGFWHTGYMDHHETDIVDPFSRGSYKPEPVTYPCPSCDRIFDTADDLALHLFDGHATERPMLFLRGRECGRTRRSIIEPTEPEHWTLVNVDTARVNGRAVDPASAPTLLSQLANGVVTVELNSDKVDQRFEFSLEIAETSDLDRVDRCSAEVIAGRSLTINAIETFIDATSQFRSARRYRDGIVNYYYGVLAREGSPESGLAGADHDGVPAYRSRFNDAAASLGMYDRPSAEAITALVALHYNQFDIAMTRTRSPRAAAVALRLQQLLNGADVDSAAVAFDTPASLDYSLSDSISERILHWGSCALDESSADEFTKVEQAITGFDPLDQFKLRLLAAEYYLRVGETDDGLRHHRELRNNPDLDRWSDRYRARLAEATTP